MFRYKCCIEYDGTFFCGLQRQNNAITIQETIENAIFQILNIEITIFCAGRTDTGVHALKQVCHFDSPKYFEPMKLQHAINYYLKDYLVCIYNVKLLPQGSNFHARFCAEERCYTYKIINQNYPSKIHKNYAWWINKPLDTNIMQQAGNLLLGTHNFTTFRASGCQSKSPIKTINKLDINKYDSFININICAPSFLYRQVRNVVGSLVKVGLNKWSLEDFQKAFKACDRTKGATTAPAHGLYFVDVKY